VAPYHGGLPHLFAWGLLFLTHGGLPHALGCQVQMLLNPTAIKACWT